VYRRAVVPLDGSLTAEAIVPFILEIAGPLDMEVVLVRVVVPIAPVVVEASRHVLLEDADQRRADAAAYLKKVAAPLVAKGVRVSTEVRYGRAVEEIVAVARDVNADLVAMTTHGRGALGRLLFGSVAEAVLREADIPVFMLRQTERQLTGAAPVEAYG
jgi:nucleotide-binding universal stress UspA family protein